ncbi:MAG: TRAP transporter large permease [Candidimonas sp.]|nr:MAG: TRAP transporter large permease [Candidimonas sp.]
MDGFASVTSIVLLFALLTLGVPVFVSLALAGIAGFLFVQDATQVLQNLGQLVWQSTLTYELVAIPLFIFAGILMEKTGAAEDLFAATKAWVGRVPNSLSVATVFACGVFASITGSSIATAATVGVVAIPLLLREGYSDVQAGGCVAGGGTLGIIFPPSIPLILYGVITETSIGKLFVAGLLPGVILLVAFAVYVSLRSPRQFRTEDITWAQRWAVTRKGIGVLILPILIIGSIYLGLATPTEAGALSVVYVMVLATLQRRFSFQRCFEAGRVAMKTTSMLFMLIIFGEYFAHFLTFEQLPDVIAAWVTSHSTSMFITITFMNVAYLVLGAFLETAAMLLISVPIFFPISTALHIDPVTFGIYVAISMEVSQIHPPIGINLLTVHGISKIPLWHLTKGVIPFLVFEFLMLYAVIFYPALTQWLPSRMFH